MRPTSYRTAEQIFWDNITVNLLTGCWEWDSRVEADGYGKFSHRGIFRLEHRFSYELHYGPIVSDFHVDHLCRNRKCVNPKHLELVPRELNIKRGIGITAVNARKQFCLNGHPYDAQNTIPRRTGGRYCKACNALGKRKARKAAARRILAETRTQEGSHKENQ